MARARTLPVPRGTVESSLVQQTKSLTSLRHDKPSLLSRSKSTRALDRPTRNHDRKSCAAFPAARAQNWFRLAYLLYAKQLRRLLAEMDRAALERTRGRYA